MRNGQPMFGTIWDLVKLSAAVTAIKIITTIFPAALIWDRIRKPILVTFYLSLSPSDLFPWPVADLYELFPPVTLSSWLRGDSDTYTAQLCDFSE